MSEFGHRRTQMMRLWRKFMFPPGQCWVHQRHPEKNISRTLKYFGILSHWNLSEEDCSYPILVLSPDCRLTWRGHWRSGWRTWRPGGAMSAKTPPFSEGWSSHPRLDKPPQQRWRERKHKPQYTAGQTHHWSLYPVSTIVLLCGWGPEKDRTTNLKNTWYSIRINLHLCGCFSAFIGRAVKAESGFKKRGSDT